MPCLAQLRKGSSKLAPDSTLPNLVIHATRLSMHMVPFPSRTFLPGIRLSGKTAPVCGPRRTTALESQEHLRSRHPRLRLLEPLSPALPRTGSSTAVLRSTRLHLEIRATRSWVRMAHSASTSFSNGTQLLETPALACLSTTTIALVSLVRQPQSRQLPARLQRRPA